MYDMIILRCMDTQFLQVGSPKFGVGWGEMVEDPVLGGQSM